jgi:hypothetical protein
MWTPCGISTSPTSPTSKKTWISPAKSMVEFMKIAGNMMDFTSEIHGFHQWLNHRLPSEKFYPCHLHGDDDSPTTKIQKKGEFMGNLPSPVAALELSPFLLWCFV